LVASKPSKVAGSNPALLIAGMLGGTTFTNGRNPTNVSSILVRRNDGVFQFELIKLVVDSPETAQFSNLNLSSWWSRRVFQLELIKLVGWAGFYRHPLSALGVIRTGMRESRKAFSCFDRNA
jgi:hypothetical protein